MTVVEPNAALQAAHAALVECQVQLLTYLSSTTRSPDERYPPIHQLAHGLDVARYVLSAEQASLRLP